MNERVTPSFDAPCGHEGCMLLTQLAKEIFDMASTDPRYLRSAELEGLSNDTTGALMAVMELLAARIIAADIREAAIEVWGYGHQN